MLLIEPGAVIAKDGQASLKRMIPAMQNHRGPIFVIDSSLSANASSYDAVMAEAFRKAGERGFEGARIWGSPDMLMPYAGWPGCGDDVHGCQAGALISIAPRIMGRSVLLMMAWDVEQDAIIGPLRAMGWDGDVDRPAERRSEEKHRENPDPILHFA